MNSKEDRILRKVKRKLDRGALLVGVVGGIIGAVAGGIGIIWSIIDILYMQELIRTLNDPFLIIRSIYFSPYPVTYVSIPTSTGTLLFEFSIMLAILFMVGGTLTGVGFYGVYKEGGGNMGLVGLISGIIGGVIGGIFLILGNLLQVQSGPSLGPIFLSVLTPNYFDFFIGLAVLGIALILLGVASRAVRIMIAHPSASATAGSLSIVGGCLLFPYILNYLAATLGDIPLLFAFPLILSAFAIWAAVFHGSRTM
jgi:hypothetical protein